MTDQEEATPGSSPLAEYYSFNDELIEHLKEARQGYDLTLPLREAFASNWDIRIQIAYLPAPGGSFVGVHEFYLVGLVRDGEVFYAKRCDYPFTVGGIVDELVFDGLGEDVPVPEDAHMNGSRRNDDWPWMRSETEVPFLTPSFDEAYAAHERLTQEYRASRQGHRGT
ncbi:hypothetical protein ACPFL9_20375 [Paenarthrobacter sp. NyZ202]|uniref:hypothetical protein n=1 Tax=Paenarthrobacter sp. NyZ202 TaxID=3402689 RepID=UPI003CEE7372